MKTFVQVDLLRGVGPISAYSSEERHSMGRYQPALLPDLSGTSSHETMNEKWGRYKRSRADDAMATQALEGYMSQIENHLFNAPVLPQLGKSLQ